MGVADQWKRDSEKFTCFSFCFRGYFMGYSETPYNLRRIMNRFLENLQRQAEENPVLAMGVAAALITAVSKLNDSRVNSKNSNAWAKEVDRRVNTSKKK
jgi:hypothetical protein